MAMFGIRVKIYLLSALFPAMEKSTTKRELK